MTTEGEQFATFLQQAIDRSDAAPTDVRDLFAPAETEGEPIDEDTTPTAGDYFGLFLNSSSLLELTDPDQTDPTIEQGETE